MKTLFATAAAVAAAGRLAAAGIEDLETIETWKKLAHGVHVAELGDPEQIARYTDLAGAPPRIETLNTLPDAPLTGALRNARYRVGGDGRLLVHIPTEPDEKIFGFGLQFDNTMKSGQIVELKVDHFNKGGGATHAPVPFFLSSKGYGVFYNTARYIKIHTQVGNRKDSPNNPEEVDRNPPPDEKQPGPWLAKPPGDSVEAHVHAGGIELVAFTGTDLQDIVSRYNLFSGGGAMPPLWGLGFWHRVPSKFSADETREEIKGFKKHDIPLDVIGLEPGWQTKSYPCTFEWQKKRFPDPAKFTGDLLDDGIRLNLWVNPYISRHARIYEEMYPLSGSHLVWLGIVPDYNLPAARKVLLDQHKEDHIDIGVSGYKVDEVDGYDFWLWPDHATFPSGTSAEQMRQTYGLLLQHMLHEELFRANNQRTYSLVRASNGAASNHPFVIYSDSYGHGQYITGLSSASLCGILWCPEIRSARNSREWINRMHTVCFSPMAMLNAWASGTKPWTYEDSTDAVRRTIQLRMRLLPYLYTAFADYHMKGVPPIRSMLLETGAARGRSKREERKLDGETDPYGDGFHELVTEDNSLFMFGPDILVAPFVNDQTKREVSLPPGKWYDFHSGKLAGNGGKITVTAADTGDLPPLYVRDGALVPMLKESVNRTRDIKGADLVIRHYGEKSGTCLVYEDDGETYGFEKGEYGLTRYSIDTGGDLKAEELKQSGESLYGAASLERMAP